MEEIPSELHHHISASKNSPLRLAAFVQADPNNPAKKVCEFPPLWNILLMFSKSFVWKLKDHLLNRLLGKDFDGDDPQEFTDDERNSVWITNNQIYSVKMLSINYTTYDIRRDRDTINPHNHQFVMVLFLRKEGKCGLPRVPFGLNGEEREGVTAESV